MQVAAGGKFRIGQKVRCIGMDAEYTHKLAIGSVYEIVSLFDVPGWIRVSQEPDTYEEKYFAPYNGDECECGADSLGLNFHGSNCYKNAI